MTRSTWSAVIPPLASVSSAAFSAITSTVSSGAAQRRSLIPTRRWIHSSLVSTIVSSSEFGTTRSGWKCPTATRRVPVMSAASRS